MNHQLKKRLKSLLWRAGGVAAAAGLGVVAQNLELLELPAWAVVLLGLVIGEITKWLNNKHTEFIEADIV